MAPTWGGDGAQAGDVGGDDGGRYGRGATIGTVRECEEP